MKELLTCLSPGPETLSKANLEVVAAAHGVAVPLNAFLSCVFFANRSEKVPLEQLAAQGIRRIYKFDEPEEGTFPLQYHIMAVEMVCRLITPVLAVFPGDSFGQQVAPGVAHRFGGGIITECIDLRVDKRDGSLRIHKPVYGGKALAHYRAREKQIVTIRAHCFEIKERDGSSEAEIVNLSLDSPVPSPSAREVSFIQERSSGISLEDASIIVSGGRGVGGKQEYRALEELAALLGGAAGASRAAVDSGWAPPSNQVGQTGKIVAPDLYFAIGISGASQHLAGMSRSRCIVAINTDRDAPIFRTAHFGIVEDYRKILPILMARKEDA